MLKKALSLFTVLLIAVSFPMFGFKINAAETMTETILEDSATSQFITLFTKVNSSDEPSNLNTLVTLSTDNEGIYFEIGVDANNWYGKVGNDIYVVGADRFRILPNTDYDVALIFDNESRSARLIINETVYASDSEFNKRYYAESYVFTPQLLNINSEFVDDSSISITNDYLTAEEYLSLTGITIDDTNLLSINENYLTDLNKYRDKLNKNGNYLNNVLIDYSDYNNELQNYIKAGSAFKVKAETVDLYKNGNKVYELLKDEIFNISTGIPQSGQIEVRYGNDTYAYINLYDLIYGCENQSIPFPKTHSTLFSGRATADFLESLNYNLGLYKSDVTSAGTITDSVSQGRMYSIAIVMIIGAILIVVFDKIVRGILKKKISLGMKLPIINSRSFGTFTFTLLFIGAYISAIYSVNSTSIKNLGLPLNYLSEYSYSHIGTVINPANWTTFSQIVIFVFIVLFAIFIVRQVILLLNWYKLRACSH
jgi:hypothetical protein